MHFSSAARNRAKAFTHRNDLVSRKAGWEPHITSSVAMELATALGFWTRPADWSLERFSEACGRFMTSDNAMMGIQIRCAQMMQVFTTYSM
jgi:hypothetical protein